jgi:hypothetical protein
MSDARQFKQLHFVAGSTQPLHRKDAGKFYNSSVVFGFEVPIRECRRTVGASNPPHQVQLQSQ